MYFDSFIPQIKPEIPPYVQYPALLSPPECAEIIRLGEGKLLQPGLIGNGDTGAPFENPDYRKVLTCQIAPEEAPWAYERLRDSVARTNEAYFRYDINGLYEQLVFLKYTYDENQPGKYNWHQDIGGGMSSLRKLSTVTQLSNPGDYDGCRLRLFTNCDFDPDRVGRGDTIIFPSYLPHCVTPITRGVRYSLVSWITGPQYR